MVDKVIKVIYLKLKLFLLKMKKSQKSSLLAASLYVVLFRVQGLSFKRLDTKVKVRQTKWWLFTKPRKLQSRRWLQRREIFFFIWVINALQKDVVDLIFSQHAQDETQLINFPFISARGIKYGRHHDAALQNYSPLLARAFIDLAEWSEKWTRRKRTGLLFQITTYCCLVFTKIEMGWCNEMIL